MSKRHQVLTSFLEKRSQPDFWLNCALYAFAGVVFLPITLWFAATTNEQSRILNALMVLVMAIFLLVLYGRIEVKETLTLNKSARNTLFAAYGLLILNFFARHFLPPSSEFLYFSATLLSIPAYCCAMASVVFFVLGEGTRRIVYTAGGTLCTFLLLSVFMAPLDWPLRTLAGKWTGSALTMLGKDVELGIVGNTVTQPPQLILMVNEHPFHVASECNGFGVILTALLLAVLLSIYRKLGTVDFLINIAAGITLGFIFNTLRIIIIVLLAPSMMEHYHLMHEITGTITYWGCLILSWILLKGPTRREA